MRLNDQNLAELLKFKNLQKELAKKYQYYYYFYFYVIFWEGVKKSIQAKFQGSILNNGYSKYIFKW